MLVAERAQIAATVFLSPPWGGPEYLSAAVCDLRKFQDIVRVARDVVGVVAIFVPRNISWEQAVELFGACEVEYNFTVESGEKTKTITIYFGGLTRKRTTLADRPAESFLDEDGFEIDDKGNRVDGLVLWGCWRRWSTER